MSFQTLFLKSENASQRDQRNVETKTPTSLLQRLGRLEIFDIWSVSTSTVNCANCHCDSRVEKSQDSPPRGGNRLSAIYQHYSSLQQLYLRESLYGKDSAVCQLPSLVKIDVDGCKLQAPPLQVIQRELIVSESTHFKLKIGSCKYEH